MEQAGPSCKPGRKCLHCCHLAGKAEVLQGRTFEQPVESLERLLSLGSPVAGGWVLTWFLLQ